MTAKDAVVIEAARIVVFDPDDKIKRCETV
jgi:hypothetical protein